MRIARLPSLLAALSIFAFAGAAAAVPITMTPNPAEVGAMFGNDFSLVLDSGDTDTNILNFTVEGAGCNSCLSVAVAAIVFDDVSVLTATDSSGGFWNDENVVRGVVTPDGAVAGILVDWGEPNSESFSLQLDGTPTTATLYALSSRDIDGIQSKKQFFDHILDSTDLTFSTGSGGTGTKPTSAVPEPSAALVFAAGLLVAQAGIRRRI